MELHTERNLTKPKLLVNTQAYNNKTVSPNKRIYHHTSHTILLTKHQLQHCPYHACGESVGCEPEELNSIVEDVNFCSSFWPGTQEDLG